ncbi:uncharacterized protein LOC131209600 [Anopheles bellator]|uniref:uncharacterized protein LOC131209600 n=1 Tax=Anopheles bellator TaxID=139047 RepID=UPI0026470057|nr:uncharacterized protein LOC131209600 [Anopheles bellator]
MQKKQDKKISGYDEEALLEALREKKEKKEMEEDRSSPEATSANIIPIYDAAIVPVAKDESREQEIEEHEILVEEGIAEPVDNQQQWFGEQMENQRQWFGEQMENQRQWFGEQLAIVQQSIAELKELLASPHAATTSSQPMPRQQNQVTHPPTSAVQLQLPANTKHRLDLLEAAAAHTEYFSIVEQHVEKYISENDVRKPTFSHLLESIFTKEFLKTCKWKRRTDEGDIIFKTNINCLNLLTKLLQQEKYNNTTKRLGLQDVRIKMKSYLSNIRFNNRNNAS